jgi:hypothetical protein
VQYALELYMRAGGRDGVPETAARARAAAEELDCLGTAIRFVRSISLPDDEILFLVFDACAGDAVAEAGGRASIPFERVIAMEVRGA